MTAHAVSTPRIHHQVFNSWRIIRWLLFTKPPASARCRPKARTTRMPPNTSVLWASTVCRVRRTSRNIGRIFAIQVRWVSHATGSTAMPPSSSFQSMVDNTTSVPKTGSTPAKGCKACRTPGCPPPPHRRARSRRCRRSSARNTRCSGSREACSKALRRTSLCRRLVIRVACQRPHKATVTDTSTSTITMQTSVSNSVRGWSAPGSTPPARRAAARSPSTVSTTSFGMYSGTSDTSVATVSAARAATILPWCSDIRPQNAAISGPTRRTRDRFPPGADGSTGPAVGPAADFVRTARSRVRRR